MQTLLEFLEKISPISRQSRDAIAKISEKRKYQKKENLLNIGQTCKHIFYIRNGAARVYYFKEASEITESFTFSNNIITRPESLFTGKPSKKGIQLLEDSEVISLNAEELFNLFEQHHDLERLFRKMCELSYVKAINRLESIQFCTAKERYNNLLAEDPNIIQKIPLKYVASFLGVTPVSLSRIRSKK
jgi:CRP-like cAMP-binding protein